MRSRRPRSAVSRWQSPVLLLQISRHPLFVKLCRVRFQTNPPRIKTPVRVLTGTAVPPAASWRAFKASINGSCRAHARRRSVSAGVSLAGRRRRTVRQTRKPVVQPPATGRTHRLQGQALAHRDLLAGLPRREQFTVKSAASGNAVLTVNGKGELLLNGQPLSTIVGQNRSARPPG